MENLIFIGDSVTDRDRLLFPPFGLGYVREIVRLIPRSFNIINVGISGNRLVDLENRWEVDVIENDPQMLSIAIGINDTWRRYDSNDPTKIEDFEARYRRLLTRTKEKCEPTFVLCEPFLLSVTPEMKSWREDLDLKIEVVHKLAKEFSGFLVPFDQMFTEESKKFKIEELAPDGIHPTALGYKLMAKLWISTVFKE
jgi:lysophospholipase L1-like esterase